MIKIYNCENKNAIAIDNLMKICINMYKNYKKILNLLDKKIM